MLKDILSVSGKPGLFKLVSNAANFTIVESLIDQKRIPVYANNSMSSLSASSIFTDEGEVSVSEVLTSIKEKEEGKAVSIDLSKAEGADLRAYMAEVLPNFDRNRVYPSDIKKLLKWYDILIACGITDFSIEETSDEEIKEENATSDDEKEAQKTAAPLNAPPVAKPTTTLTKRKDMPLSSVKTAKSAKPKLVNAIPKKSIVGSKRGS